MLTSVHIENFRGFEKFDLKLGAKQLIMGPSGSGKTTLCDVLGLLRDFVIRGFKTDDIFNFQDLTRWLDLPRQVFELSVEIKNNKYWYRLRVDREKRKEAPLVLEEHLQCNDKALFDCERGAVRVYDDRSIRKAAYNSDPNRSALTTAAIQAKSGNSKLVAFQKWFEGVYCLRPDPRVMTGRAENEASYLERDAHNFASIYRYWLQEDSETTASLRQSLRKVIERFESLDAVSSGQNVRILTAKMKRLGSSRNGRSEFDLAFSELSDGERQLIFLYFLALCIVPHASTICLDEPDNYLQLAEIQPWLGLMEESVEEHQAQVLMISHHPELLDQWATPYGIRFDRTSKGAIYAESFSTKMRGTVLPPSELVARGWDND